MPVHFDLPSEGMLYQRQQYEKGGVGRRYWDYRDKVIFSFIEERHKRIADLGCGEGITLGKLQRTFTGREIVGVDLSDENVEICRSFGLNVVHSNIRSLPFPDKSFDLCLLLEVLEHVDEWQRVLSEAYRALDDGGRLIILVPFDRNFLLARLATLKIKEAFYNPGHVRQWRPKELRSLLEKSGFSVIAERNIPFLLWQMSLHHLVVADKTQAA